MRRTLRLRSVAVLALAGTATFADDDFLERWAATYGFRLGRPENVRPTPDGKSVLFLRSGPRDFARQLFEVDLASGRERRLADGRELLGGAEETLSPEERARRERQRLVARGIATFELSRDGGRVLIPLGNRLFVLERDAGRVLELPAADEPPLDPQLSPDGTRIAFVRGGELWVVDIASRSERQLTSGAGPGVTQGLAEFVAQEEMGRHHGFWWSPDSRRIAYQRTDTSAVEPFHLADALHADRAPATWPYPRPGKPNARVRLGVIAAGGGPTTWLDWDTARHEYLAAVTWDREAPLTVLLQDRRQTEARLMAAGDDGTLTELLVERDPAWVEIESDVPRWLPGGAGFLWVTERRGARQLELRRSDGALGAVLTPLELGFDRLEHVTPDGKTAIVRASADPTESHLYRVAIADAAPPPVRLTTQAGVHEVVSSGEGASFVVRSAGPATPASWELFDPAGPTGVRLRSAVEDPGFVPHAEWTTVGSDPAFHAVVIRPRRAAPAGRRAVVLHVYGGPTSQMVRREASRYLLDQWIADRGDFVVVAIDGRGTPGRGRDWQRAVRLDLISQPLEDQAAALGELGRRDPQLDLGRVGIFGWSFGGYFSALAAMRRPDVFHAAVAGAPVVDWRDYDTHYTERYMGLPADNPEGYERTSALRWAAELERPLLLIHGTGDDNVYFLHSLKLADALFRAGKPFEFLPLAGLTHMVPDPVVTRRLYERIVGFFERELGVETRRARDSAAAAP